MDPINETAPSVRQPDKASLALFWPGGDSIKRPTPVNPALYHNRTDHAETDCAEDLMRLEGRCRHAKVASLACHS